MGPHGTHVRAPSGSCHPHTLNHEATYKKAMGLLTWHLPTWQHGWCVCQINHTGTLLTRGDAPDGDPPTKVACVSQGTVRPQDFPRPPALRSPFSLLLHSSEIITKVNSQHRAQALISGDHEWKCSVFLGTALSAP